MSVGVYINHSTTIVTVLCDSVKHVAGKKEIKNFKDSQIHHSAI